MGNCISFHTYLAGGAASPCLCQFTQETLIQSFGLGGVCPCGHPVYQHRASIFSCFRRAPSYFPQPIPPSVPLLAPVIPPVDMAESKLALPLSPPRSSGELALASSSSSSSQPRCFVCCAEISDVDLYRMSCGHLYHTVCAKNLFNAIVKFGSSAPTCRCGQVIRHSPTKRLLPIKEESQGSLDSDISPIYSSGGQSMAQLDQPTPPSTSTSQPAVGGPGGAGAHRP